MAQPIYCDVEGCQNGADLLITQIHTGSVQAMCNEHYAEFVFSMATQMIEAEATDENSTSEEQITASTKGEDENEPEAKKEGKAETDQTPEQEVIE